MDVACIDPLTLALIDQPDLDDIVEIGGQSKGKARADSDEQFALAYAERVYVEALQISSDFRFALSLNNALGADYQWPVELSVINQAECEDHEAALALECQRQLELHARSQSQEDSRSKAPTDYLPSQLVEGALEVDQSGSQSPNQPGASLSSNSTNDTTGLTCISCRETLTEASPSVRGLCGHLWCGDCVRRHIVASFGDKTLLPLRCDNQPLPMSNILKLLDPHLRTKYQKVAEECAVPAPYRLYCSRRSCLQYLGAIGDRQADVTCPACSQRVCPRCKCDAHPGYSCGEEEGERLFHELVEQRRWQTCPSCHATVQLTHGCYHMTCRCSAQFCYLCGQRWKLCNCPNSDERHL
ncbi:hypothetical protein FISHEDRAFT_42569 [Fistulina hepatica ATCC 64428]|uniref:RBR-type E3 ubiquitin transferase n=1 Tax=Fistulina hepatica ATCC 64428 TaxID=1128425 RepID=A0A0D7AEI8_9AGAR|nr:hypothetical protein FISHEDRAFT_42569 [Fistulina hepatica ATCC 64428]